MDWIVSIIDTLQTTQDYDRQLVSAVCMTYLIVKVNIQFNKLSIQGICIPLLKFLCLRPVLDTNPPHCPEYDHWCKLQLFTPEQRLDSILI